MSLAVTRSWDSTDVILRLIASKSEVFVRAEASSRVSWRRVDNSVQVTRIPFSTVSTHLIRDAKSQGYFVFDRTGRSILGRYPQCSYGA